ncbi:hypothetical protein ISF6_0840 [Piscinibacter sakaiensis]|uniref:Uncharacterized protein n=2 Tax=Piscinibacter sakaiensis TaxID=1547922 RepID=A0A0K8NY85_PISS1|nr:hypothetical protein ISF6_0840 [Piscinibacter sakaiensis]
MRSLACVLLGGASAVATAQSVDRAPAAAPVDGIQGRAVQAVGLTGREDDGASAGSLRAGIELTRIDPALEDPQASTARLYRLDASPQAPVSPELRTRLWWGNARGALGAGADWAAAPAGSALRPLRPVVGVRAEVSEQARLTYELRAPASSLALSGSAAALAGAAPEARLGLEFRSAPSAARNLRNGLFRVQLSNSSALFVRPRSGGMMLSYRSQF